MMKRKHVYYEALVGRREGSVCEVGLQKRFCAHTSIIARLKLDRKLKGHQGCVSPGREAAEASISRFDDP